MPICSAYIVAAYILLPFVDIRFLQYSTVHVYIHVLFVYLDSFSIQ